MASRVLADAVTPAVIVHAARHAGVALPAHERLDRLLAEVDRLAWAFDLPGLRVALAAVRAEAEDPAAQRLRHREVEAVRRSGALRGTPFERPGGY